MHCSLVYVRCSGETKKGGRGGWGVYDAAFMRPEAVNASSLSGFNCHFFLVVYHDGSASRRSATCSVLTRDKLWKGCARPCRTAGARKK